jgi:hypothetical protein
MSAVEDRCDMFLWWRDEKGISFPVKGALAGQQVAETCDDSFESKTPATVLFPCAMPMYCNYSLYSRAAAPLLKMIPNEQVHDTPSHTLSHTLYALSYTLSCKQGFAFEHPTRYQHVSREGLRALVDSPFLYARKFESSKQLDRELASLLGL